MTFGDKEMAEKMESEVSVGQPWARSKAMQDYLASTGRNTTDYLGVPDDPSYRHGNASSAWCKHCWD